MVDVSQMLGATSSDAESFSDEIFSYEKRIAEIFPTGNNEDPFTSHRRLTLSKLKEIAGMVRLTIMIDTVSYIVVLTLCSVVVGPSF